MLYVFTELRKWVSAHFRIYVFGHMSLGSQNDEGEVKTNAANKVLPTPLATSRRTYALETEGDEVGGSLSCSSWYS